MHERDQIAIHTIRVLAAEAVEKARSGHPGMPLGAAPMAFTLWAHHLKHNPANPAWPDRDRFVLSAGHGSMLLYALLHLFGYGLSLEDLKGFRQWRSKTPGHPEYGHTPGVETTTGPLGQGLANAVGMALAEAHLAARFNRPGHEIINHRTYALAGDGCLMEGITGEAASLAGTLGLSKLIVLYDANDITIEGSTDLAFREDVGLRFQAYGWRVLEVEEGNDTRALSRALEAAKTGDRQPSLIKVKTRIGYGSPREGQASAHGEPLGKENLQKLKENLGFGSREPFTVPREVREYLQEMKGRLAAQEREWQKKLAAYQKAYPDLASRWQDWQQGKLPLGEMAKAGFWSPPDRPQATRVSSGEILNQLAGLIPNLMGGSADLAPSNKTLIKGGGSFSREDYSGRNLHFGVREHAMAAMANGLAAHGGLIPYAATFLVFSDYLKPALRLSALMGLPVLYIFTHDSIGVGEDGPTHQPVEHLAALRGIPNLVDFRPADYRETAAGWYAALENRQGPTALILTRQDVPQLPGTGFQALKGAYTLLDSDREEPDLILMASGSEVQLLCRAHALLREKGIEARVVSMPSMKLFDGQEAGYREKVLPPKVRARLAVEAGSSFGWHKYTGSGGGVIALDTFGASAPGEVLFREFGFTVENIVQKALALLCR